MKKFLKFSTIIILFFVFSVLGYIVVYQYQRHIIYTYEKYYDMIQDYIYKFKNDIF